jgi:anti-sigma B factor antagonist
MKLQIDGDTLRISDFKELNAQNAAAFREQACSAMANGERNIDIDFSQAAFLDSCGLGALVALHKLASARNGKVRLLNPLPPVEQILDLTRMHSVFQIVKS